MGIPERTLRRYIAISQDPERKDTPFFFPLSQDEIVLSKVTKGKLQSALLSTSAPRDRSGTRRSTAVCRPLLVKPAPLLAPLPTHRQRQDLAAMPAVCHPVPRCTPMILPGPIPRILSRGVSLRDHSSLLTLAWPLKRQRSPARGSTCTAEFKQERWGLFRA